ncbi:SH3 domain-binding protein 5-like [Neopsephotus bourkii]|uniref:SH3 domain-binding protein 5-like n=1 Tax=Neopsephotus bourkii TaxID=309878 RepID=UPI002AA598FA|nr:SH3 domain-binding protein 5-like [Neopsephotus bourkii]
MGAILKSKPYFELKAHLNRLLEEHKATVTALEARVTHAKTRYSVALRNLEEISEQIHARRRHRRSPIGAEGLAPPPPSESTPIGSRLGVGGASGDDLSVLSLQTIASDLQKFDSVEHLMGLSDATSLHGEDMEGGQRYRAAPGHLKHHRSVSL